MVETPYEREVVLQQALASFAYGYPPDIFEFYFGQIPLAEAEAAALRRPEQSRQGRYVITDPYLRFYFRFLSPHLAAIEQGRVRQATSLLYDHLLDFIGTHTFEELCRDWVGIAAEREPPGRRRWKIMPALLARPDASDLALIGSGVQARSHLEAMLAVRAIGRVRVHSPNRERRQKYVAWAWRLKTLRPLTSFIPGP